MNAVVTGAAGFIGSSLVTRLLDAGAQVTGVDCFTDYYARALKEANVNQFRDHARCRFVETKIATADWNELLTDVTHVFHLAAQAGVRRSWGRDFAIYTTCNVDATQVLLEACVGRDLQRVVYASSSSVYGDGVTIPMREDARPQPVSPYGVTKLAAEHLCHLYFTNYGVPSVSLRYFTVYGPRQRPDMAFHRFLRAMQTGEPISLYGDGEQTRDFTFVDDAVSATAAAADRGVVGRVYNIGGGSRVSMNRVLELMETVTGQVPTIVREPVQRGDVRDTYADTTLARKDLGFVPATGLEDGIGAEFEWISTIPVLTS